MAQTNAPDLILHNASIHTMQTPDHVASAVAVADGRVVAVGDNATVLAAKGDATVVEDLGGATVIPGVIDSHNHMHNVGPVLQDVDLYDIRSIENVLAKLSERAAGLSGDAPVVGRGDCLHPASLAEGRLPDRSDLDRIATDRTVAVTDVNKTILNSHALAQLTIDEAQIPPGGVIGRDEATGELDGRFFYGAKLLTPLGAQSASLSDVSVSDALRAASDALSGMGITSVVIPGAPFDVIVALRELASRGELTVRVTAMPPIAVLDEPERVAELGLSCGAGDDMVRTGPLKLFHDGFIMHRTALMHEPFEGQPENRGMRKQSVEELNNKIRRATEAGWPVGVHVTGDRALDEAVDAFAAFRSPHATCPHHVIHAYFLSTKTKEQMAKAGIAAALQPVFLRAWGDTVCEHVGDERGANFLALRAYLEAGIVTGGGSDAPISCPQPGLGIAPAVTRATSSGRVLGEAEAISVAQAVHLYTLGSASVTAEHENKGSIAPGSLADMVVLDRDIFTSSGEDLATLPVRRTILGGKTVYERK